MDMRQRGITRALASLLCALGFATSCIHTTPFESEPSVDDLTAKNLAELDARGPAPRPFKFAAFGDTHSDYDNLRRTVAAINARDDIEFVLITGDMTNLGLLQEFEWSNDAYEELDVPYLTVIGNHDALGQGQEIYREMYGPYDYSFSFGGIKFVMFNSNTLEFEGAAPDREWLVDQVDNRPPDEHVILVAHHDLTQPDDYADGNTAEFYVQLVQHEGVIGVIHGHNAEFELIAWNGVTVLQTGTYEKVFMHTIVTVDGSTLSYEACSFEQCTPIQPIKELGIE
jgi:3',5'-cyclic AMP phosphodiesterase CpdA